MELTSDDKHYDDLPQGTSFLVHIYINLFETVFYNHNLLCEILEYVLTEKRQFIDSLVRNSPMNTILVNIDNEFLLQCQMCFLLEPQ
jgi:hypothetical protein